MPSEILPAFTVRALFLHSEFIEATNTTSAKTKINFAVDSVNKNGMSRTQIPLELAHQIGAYISCKVDSKRYMKLEHLLKKDSEVSVTLTPTPWRVGEGSGVFYDLIEIEPFGL